MSKRIVTLTNSEESAKLFADYFDNESYRERLRTTFRIQCSTTPGGYAYNQATLPFGAEAAEADWGTIDTYCFSALIFFYALVPQTIGNELDHASMYRFHRATGIPMFTAEGGFMPSPAGILREVGLFPGNDAIAVHSAFVFNLRPLLKERLTRFFGMEMADKVADHDAYSILCHTMRGRLADVWEALDKETKRTFLLSDPFAEGDKPYLLRPIGSGWSFPTFAAAEDSQDWLSSLNFLLDKELTTSRKKNPLKLTLKSRDAIMKWNAGIKSRYFLSDDFVVPLAIELYSRRRDRDERVLEDIEKQQRIKVDLADILDKQDIDTLRGNYSAVIHECFVRTFHPKAYPPLLLDAIVDMIDPQFGETVLNPFFTSQSFVYLLAQRGCRCAAFEQSSMCWDFSKIYLDALNSHSVFTQSLAWAPAMAPREANNGKQGHHRRYDIIVACVADENQEDFDIALSGWVENLLNPGGTIAVLLPETANAADGRWQELRANLVNHRLLRDAVRLTHDKEAHAVWIIGDTTSDKVRLAQFDLSQISAEHGAADLLRDTAGEYSPSLLKKANYCFSPERHTTLKSLFDKERKLCRKSPATTTLGKIIDLQPCEEVAEGSGLWMSLSGKSLSRPTYSDTLLSSTVRLEGLRNKEFINAKIVVPPAIVAVEFGGSMKVARLPEENDFGGEPVHAAADAFVFRPKDTAVCTEDYLIYLITHPDVARQAALFSTLECRGESMQLRFCRRKLTEESFRAIQVIVPSLEDQRTIVSHITMNDLDILRESQEQHIAALEKDLRIKRHSLGQTLTNLSCWCTILQSTLQRNPDGIRATDPIGDNLGRTVADVMKSIDDTLKELLGKAKELTFELSYTSETFDLRRETEHFASTHSYSCCRLVCDWDANIDSDTLIHFPVEALRLILENIVNNAVSHGFAAQRDAPANEVRFSLNACPDGRCQLTVANNGAPFPERLNPADIFEFGKSIPVEGESSIEDNAAHSGIGGYQIKQLMDKYGSEALAESRPDEDFKVLYHLYFETINNR